MDIELIRQDSGGVTFIKKITTKFCFEYKLLISLLLFINFGEIELVDDVQELVFDWNVLLNKSSFFNSSNSRSFLA